MTGEVRGIRLLVRPCVAAALVCCGSALLLGAGTALAAPPAPTPDPAPAPTTTTAPATTTRTTTTPATKPATSTSTTTRSTRTTQPARTTTPTPVAKPATAKRATRPAVEPKPRRVHPKLAKPAAPPKRRGVQTAHVAPVPAVVGSTGHAGGQRLAHLLLLVAALALLAVSVVPTRLVALRAGVNPARAASIRTGFAVAGLSVGAGFVIALLLSKTP